MSIVTLLKLFSCFAVSCSGEAHGSRRERLGRFGPATCAWTYYRSMAAELALALQRCERCAVRDSPVVAVCRGFCGRRVCRRCHEDFDEGTPFCLDCLRTGIWVPGRGLCPPEEFTEAILDQADGAEGTGPDMDCGADVAPEGGGAAADDRDSRAGQWIDYRSGNAGGRGGGRPGPWPTNLPLRDGWMCSVCSTWVCSRPQSTERARWCVRCLGYPAPSGVAEYLVTYPDSKGRVWILLCDYCEPLDGDNAMEQQDGRSCCRRRTAVE
jgi:hypothetical protein